MKIVFIGGGSVQWTPKLVTDVALTGTLAGAALVLHDVDADALELLAHASERIVAVGRYSLNEKTGLAETALIVHENSRRLGIGRHLQMRLREYAERCGIVGFTGSFEPSNVATLRLHRRLGDAVVTEQGEGRYVAYFSGGGKSGEEEPGEGPEAPAPKKAPKTPKKRAGRRRK